MTARVELSGEAKQFLVWLRVERGRSEATLEAYARDLRAHLGWLTERGFTPLTAGESEISEYLAERQRSGLATATVARSMVSVRSLYRFMVSERLRPDDPSRDLELPKVGRGLPKGLSEADVERLLAEVLGDGPSERRDRALLEVLYGTGVRISEAVGLSLSDLDLGEGLARVLGKGDKQRVVPIGRCARVALVDWLDPKGRGSLEPRRWRDRDDSEAVFLNVRGARLSRQGGWGVVKKYGAKVGLGARLSPHTLRHSCATHMLDHGADIRTVQELLGHASITTTQIYTGVSLERLAQAYDDAHPRSGART